MTLTYNTNLDHGDMNVCSQHMNWTELQFANGRIVIHILIFISPKRQQLTVQQMKQKHKYIHHSTHINKNTLKHSYPQSNHTYDNTHTRLTALFPGLPGWAVYQKGKTNLDFTRVRDSGAICKSAPRSTQITMPAPHLCFYRPDALPAAQPTASKHRRQVHWRHMITYRTLIVLVSLLIMYHFHIFIFYIFLPFYHCTSLRSDSF